MSSPADLQTDLSTIQWTNGRGLITGATLLGVMTIVLGIFGTLGTWSSSGVYTPNIPPGTVTSAMLAPGVSAGLLGSTGVTAGTYGDAADVPAVAVGADGRIIGVTPTPITIPGSAVTGPFVDVVVTFATLPTSASTPPVAKGERVFCSDCLKPGQSAGAGTGMPEFYDGTGWFSAAGTAAAH